MGRYRLNNLKNKGQLAITRDSSLTSFVTRRRDYNKYTLRIRRRNEILNSICKHPDSFLIQYHKLHHMLKLCRYCKEQNCQTDILILLKQFRNCFNYVISILLIPVNTRKYCAILYKPHVPGPFAI